MPKLAQALHAARTIETGSRQHIAARDVCIARGLNPDSYVNRVGNEPPITNWQRVAAELAVVAAFHEIAGEFGPILEQILDGQQALALEVRRLTRSIETMTQAMTDQLNRLASDLDSLSSTASAISAELTAHIQGQDDSADVSTLKSLNDRLDSIVSGLSSAATAAQSAATSSATPPQDTAAGDQTTQQGSDPAAAGTGTQS